MMMTALATIAIEEIEVGQRLRDLSEAQVEALMSSIADVGLLNPIAVYACPVIRGGIAVDGYGLVAGAHRLEAFKRLGHFEITAHVVVLSDLERQIAECDENLCGTKLTPSEKAMFTKRRKDAYEALHPETKHGGDRKSDQVANSATRSYADDQADKTGVAARTVRQDADRGAKISSEVINLIRGTELDTGLYLDKIKKVDLRGQLDVAKRDLANVRGQGQKADQKRASSKIQSDVKSRAAKEVAEMLAEHIPGDWWDAIKSNLYAAGAANIANEFTNITGQSVMDRSAA